MRDSSGPAAIFDTAAHRRLLRRIIRAYDSRMVRGYCVARFLIININILHMLGLCMRGKTRILDVGCGFGLFGCYFAARYPRLAYHGIDLDAQRIAAANRAAERLGLHNIRFECRDAQTLDLSQEYDAVVMLDLMHHLPQGGKQHVLREAHEHLAAEGCLIIKDVARRPSWKLFFTWALDVLMTRGFEMWYWDERQFREAVDVSFRLEAYPIADWLPYPHVLYLFERQAAGAAGPAGGLYAENVALAPAGRGESNLEHE
ncbi:MAG: class I SAM-dependent methyltransferase [Planctomycetes bacterium]|nr:class I SAM-dependent methyltransferase [Planctomycetota bacterium]